MVAGSILITTGRILDPRAGACLDDLHHLPLLITDVLLVCLIWGLIEEILIRFMAIFDAAGPVADLTAAPVYSPKEADVTSVMPVVKRARNSLRFNWPKMRAKSGEHAFPYVALELNAAIRGMAGTSRY